MPARAGVDEQKRVKGTETKFTLGRKSKVNPAGRKLEVFLGDRNEVLLKLPNDPNRPHRRWYPTGIQQIVSNLETISGFGVQTHYETRDNKDRYSVMWIDPKGVFHLAESVESVVQGKELFKVPWVKVKAAMEKAAAKGT